MVGIEHIQQLCDLSIENLKKDPVHSGMLQDGRIKVIRGDGRLGYPEGGELLYPIPGEFYGFGTEIRQGLMMRFMLVLQHLSCPRRLSINSRLPAGTCLQIFHPARAH